MKSGRSNHYTTELKVSRIMIQLLKNFLQAVMPMETLLRLNKVKYNGIPFCIKPFSKASI